MNIVQSFNYNGQAIQQREDGYFNLTQMAQSNGKLLGDYLRLKSTKDYLAEASIDMGIPISGLVDVVKGGQSALQGTWGHKLVAINLARWISPKFAVWCDAHIFTLMATGQTSLAIDPLEEMRLRIQLAEIERDKAAIENRSLELRHVIVSTCPEPIQQKILGYQVVKETEVIERTVNAATGETFDGVGITYIAKSLGFKNNAQCWAWLERHGYGKNSEHWQHELTAVTSAKLPRDDFDYLKDLIKESGDRQLFLGE